VTTPYSNPPIIATYNDWGVTALGDIESLIYHQADDSLLGQIIYYGFTANASPTSVAADGSSVAVIRGTLTGLYAPAGTSSPSQQAGAISTRRAARRRPAAWRP